MADARKWGIDLDPEVLGPAVPSGIWAENLPALEAFLTASTQWRTAFHPDGALRRFGLDYAGVRAGLDGCGIEVTPALWADLQLIEHGAICATNEG